MSNALSGLVLMLLCAGGSLNCLAQTSAEEVLDAARAALGGKRLDGIRTLSVAGKHTIAMRMARSGVGVGPASDTSTSDMELSLELPDKFLKEEVLAGLGGQAGPTILECITGGRYWSDTRSRAGGGWSVVLPGGNDASRGQKFRASFVRYLLAFTLTPPTDFPITFTYYGQAEADDGTADVLDGKGPDGSSIRLFTDRKTRRPLMLTYHSGGLDVQLQFGEYREESGVLLPHLLTWSSEGQTKEQFDIRKFKINPNFGKEKFRK